MPSSPLGSTHGRTKLGVACHHRLWAAHTVERRRAWHAIIALGRQTRSNDVWRGMPSSPSRAQTVDRRWAWHAIIAFGLADIVGWRRAWHAIIVLGRQTWSNDVGRGMPSSPLGSTEGRTPSGVACHHRLWPAHTVDRHRAWHDIAAFGQHARSDVRRDMPSPPLDNTHGRTTSGVACHHRLWAAHTVERRRAWHSIITFGQHTQSATSGVACHYCPWAAQIVGNVERGMTSPPLDNTYGQ